MARYRKIDVRIWGDAKFRSLSPLPPCGQGLWFYLLTSPATTNIPGLFRASEEQMAGDLGWNLKAFREAFAEGCSRGLVKADFDARLVWIPGARKYQSPESPNVVRSWRTPWDEIPECELKQEAYQELKVFLEAKGEAFAKAFAEACPHPMANQEQEQEQNKKENTSVLLPQDVEGCSDAVSEVFAHYRTYHPRSFPKPRRNAKEARLIQARIAEGYSVADLKQAIDGYHRSAFHCGDNEKHQKYQDLELILRDGSHVSKGIEYTSTPARQTMAVQPPSLREFVAAEVLR